MALLLVLTGALGGMIWYTQKSIEDDRLRVLSMAHDPGTKLMSSLEQPYQNISNIIHSPDFQGGSHRFVSVKRVVGDLGLPKLQFMEEGGAIYEIYEGCEDRLWL